MTESVIKPGRVAVITGAAKGIGAAAARRFAEEGMRLSLFDRDGDALEAFAKTLNAECRLVTGDVTNEQDLIRLRDTTLDAFGEVALLMNNAGIKHGGGPWDASGDWRLQLESNLLSVVTLQHLFVPVMLGMNKTAAIVNLGSKEGITTPPGNAAYSAAKAGIKVLTEQLAHELRTSAGDRVTAHLLVPGFTWTDMNFPGMQADKDEKPAEAWTADQVIEHFIEHYEKGDFYIICPDNAVSPEMDAKRIAWASQDILENRPALSRWHPEWKDAFSQWMSK
ncbi:TPA: SDR family NAD(P)-dependent oxidoreductase [Yersinia enterocolitica]|uniref:SDR family NAD(P)-dependent oxidoreductase n=1 Tax=Yersinia enterocolitica TaxID=630 RepID=A0AAD2UWY9_YEREN|nr:SDR family NAD(P)-dependent oxidoreductase [Yersinia enterocolitica]EKN6064653.1 SDR family NAD(P)-dependent oxidoreductase [Yersinia enterocolitica]ELI8100351.1 SDR family NAD(P)-dependent oxidoreductase [Yersinia enterocolitica]CQQ27905.1 3-ketoacyl-ACP reductase [Yersinia enterocolitica]CRX42315.1 3-ketoacyl-ACP reductase [Yersinia enterocolitica]HDZ9653970.1 SDR family NAD(P)-dependent oxidoreductase [Yersinia enterocolitica]